ncbi:Helix-turn-helix domain-containing protein [Amycolatopsis arida]|uniref:Helix-turn-helix domain-containing protein n=1 Tax=Amycolatopsis arida TaxID=587909 RepID=A0A1I5ZI10_9PSEU|nr:helix-turn-helix domain-containing protein [Amycolatopsis arida]TDX89696.1 helix-turn-helix protein [Amycolatopsis arida]SFQ56071.1 Helix-turn-helix domain-containing protein [Amycolatopsis arida]
MAELPPRRRVRDAELMRALAHPLRAALLSYLMSAGPRTASECATAVGSTPSNCSWHLRQLARFGLVEPDAGAGGRERPWRAGQVGLELGEWAADPAVRGAQLAATGAMVGQEQELTQRYLDTLDELPAEWREAAALNAYALRVTAAELAELVDAVDRLLRPYVGTLRADVPAGARPVHVGLRAFLRIDADGESSA